MSLAVLVSGTGSILDAMVEAGLPITLVVSDRPCPAMEKAAGHDVEAVVVCRDSFGDDFDRDGYTLRLTDLWRSEASPWWRWLDLGPSWANPCTTGTQVAS